MSMTLQGSDAQGVRRSWKADVISTTASCDQKLQYVIVSIMVGPGVQMKCRATTFLM